MTPAEEDPLLERINRDLEECDASRLPPLSSEAAAAVSYFAQLADLELPPWQRHTAEALWSSIGPRPSGEPIIVTSNPGGSDGEVLLRMRERAELPPRGFSADLMIVDELMDEQPRPWWRRWWSR